MCSRRVCRKSKLLKQIEGFREDDTCTKGVFRVAELVSDFHLSVLVHTHAQERIFMDIETFSADLWIPRDFLESFSSFPRSI